MTQDKKTPPVDAARREAMKKLVLGAAYALPVVATLSAAPTGVSADQSSTDPGGGSGSGSNDPQSSGGGSPQSSGGGVPQPSASTEPNPGQGSATGHGNGAGSGFGNGQGNAHGYGRGRNGRGHSLGRD